MKIGFFGTPKIAARVLEACIKHVEIEVAFVVTNPDTASGRGQKLQASLVKEYAILNGIPVFTPEKIRENVDFIQALRSYECDYFVVVAYGKILPVELLAIPKKLSINVHGSILPKYRGASPIQSALLFGEKETGITIMSMGEKMDDGDILAIKKIPILPAETSATLFKKFEEASPDFLIETLFAHFQGKVQGIPQNHEDATYCQKFSKEHGNMNPKLSADELYRQYQAYTPWPTLYGNFEGKRLIFSKIAVPSSEIPFLDVISGLSIGQIGCFEKKVFLKTGNGILILEELKLE